MHVDIYYLELSQKLIENLGKHIFNFQLKPFPGLGTACGLGKSDDCGEKSSRWACSLAANPCGERNVSTSEDLGEPPGLCVWRDDRIQIFRHICELLICRIDLCFPV